MVKFKARFFGSISPDFVTNTGTVGQKQKILNVVLLLIENNWTF